MPSRKNAMEYFRSGRALRPPQKPRFVREVVSDAASASPSKDPVTAGQPSESMPVIDEDAPTREAGSKLPQTTETFQEPNTGGSTTPSGSPPSPPSPRLRELDDDVRMGNSDDEPPNLNATHTRDDMDLDEDIPVWDPEEEPESQSRHPETDVRSDMDLIMEMDDDISVWDPEEEAESQPRHQVPQSSSSAGIRAYQEHLRGLLSGSSVEQAQRTEQRETLRSTPRSTPEPNPRSVTVETRAEAKERYLRFTRTMQDQIRRAGERQIHPDATGRGAWNGPDGSKWPVGMEPPDAQKAEGSDKELLAELFKKA
jgi:hypothetical protein